MTRRLLFILFIFLLSAGMQALPARELARPPSLDELQSQLRTESTTPGGWTQIYVEQVSVIVDKTTVLYNLLGRYTDDEPDSSLKLLGRLYLKHGEAGQQADIIQQKSWGKMVVMYRPREDYEIYRDVLKSAGDNKLILQAYESSNGVTFVYFNKSLN